MRDYAELVKALRYCSTNDSDTPCNKQCPYYDKRDGYECIWEMMRKTADAIEELIGKACPHYHKNVHDRGDDSYCDLLNREVPKEGKR